MKSHRSDLKYKEIRLLLAKKEREKRENAETLIEELWVQEIINMIINYFIRMLTTISYYKTFFQVLIISSDFFPKQTIAVYQIQL